MSATHDGKRANPGSAITGIALKRSPPSGYRPLFLLSMILGGCTTAAHPDGRAVVISDSAGVQIVNNINAELDTAATEVSEYLRIGVVDGPEEYQFQGVRDILLANDGRVFAANGGSRTIRVYGNNGRFVHEFGGPGEGPGEFRRIAMPILWRDTVFAFDPGRSQASLFKTNGALLASFRYGYHGWGVLDFVAATPRGWLVAPYVFRRGHDIVGKPVQDTTRLGLLHPTLLPRSSDFTLADLDTTVRIIVEYPRGRLFGMSASEGGEGPGVVMNPPFFEPQPVSKTSDKGRIFIARGLPYVVDVFDLEGKHIRSIRRAHEAVSITDEHIKELLARVDAHYDTIRGREMNLRRVYHRRATFPRIGVLPVTGRLVTDNNGAVWVQRIDVVKNPVDVEWWRGEPRPTYWDVFDSAGVFKHIVRLPPRFTLQVVRDSSAIGVGRDELDVQYIVGYLIKARAPAPN